MSSDKRVFSIPWQDSGSYRKGKYLLDTGLMADCSFMVGEGASAKRFDCHKIILIAASPVFETMFCGGFKEASTTHPIPIPDSQPDVFRLFLEFIYDPCQSSAKIYYDESDYSDGDYSEHTDDVLSGKFQSYNFETLKDLLYLGNKYMIKSLGKQCCLALNRQLRIGSEECILRIFELAVTTGHKGLAKQSAMRFEEDFSLVESEFIYYLDASILCELIKYLELTPSREVLETISIFIERNCLNVDAVDVNEFEYGICKSCENPYKRKISDISLGRLDILTDWPKHQDYNDYKHLSKRSASSGCGGKSHSSYKKQRTEKINNAEPSTNKNCSFIDLTSQRNNSTNNNSDSSRSSSSGSGGKSHSACKKQRTEKINDAEPSTSKKCTFDSSSNSNSQDNNNTNNNNDSSRSSTVIDPNSPNPVNAGDRERNLEIIKQLYESVNFVDMHPIKFLKAAKKPKLSEYLSYRRKYEILEKLCKNYHRCFGYQRKRK